VANLTQRSSQNLVLDQPSPIRWKSLNNIWKELFLSHQFPLLDYPSPIRCCGFVCQIRRKFKLDIAIPMRCFHPERRTLKNIRKIFLLSSRFIVRTCQLFPEIRRKFKLDIAISTRLKHLERCACNSIWQTRFFLRIRRKFKLNIAILMRLKHLERCAWNSIGVHNHG